MIGTESLSLFFEAIAIKQGKTADEVREQIEGNAASIRETPEIVRLRHEVERLQSVNQVVADVSEEIKRDSKHARVLSIIEELIWQAECGGSLDVNDLKAALVGKRLYKC